jgi:hypothetical protein
MVFLYGMPVLMNNSDRVSVLPLVYVLVGSFFVSHILGFVRGKGVRGVVDIFISGLNAFLLYIWVFVVAPKEWQSIIFTAWAIVFAFGAFTVTRVLRDRTPYYLYACISAALIAVATIIQFEGPMLAFVFTIEISAAVFASYKIHKDLMLSSRIGLFFAVPFILGFGVVASSLWNTGLLHTPFFTLLGLATMPIMLGVYLYRERSSGAIIRPEDVDSFRMNAGGLLAAGVFFALVFVWKTLHAVIKTEYLAVLWSLVIYTIAGLDAYFAGLRKKVKSLVVSGGLLLGFVAARLLLVDIRDMDVAGRFLTFLAIGVLFTGSAFYTRTLNKKASDEVRITVD